MKLSLFSLENQLDFGDKHVFVVCVTDRAQYRTISESIIRAISGEDATGLVTLSTNGEGASLTDVALSITDCYNFDFGQRQIVSKLHKIIGSDLANQIEEVQVALQGFSEARQVVQRFCDDLGFEILLREVEETQDLVKLFSPQVDSSSYKGVLERFFGLLDVVERLEIAQLLVTTNLGQFFSYEELDEIYKYLTHKRLFLLDLTSYRRERMNPRERVLMIDEDYSEFLIL